jgi:hypothetical protein
LNQTKIMNVIDFKSLERDAGGKPVSTFPHHALEHDPDHAEIYYKPLTEERFFQAEKPKFTTCNAKRARERNAPPDVHRLPQRTRRRARNEPSKGGPGFLGAREC